MAAPDSFDKAARGALVVIDMQTKLVPHLDGGELLMQRVATILRAADLLDVLVVVTEQNPRGLGGTVENLLGERHRPIEKDSFDATPADTFLAALPPAPATLWIAGTEAHVCVLLTALGLLGRDYRVECLADAVLSARGGARESAAGRRAHQHRRNGDLRVARRLQASALPRSDRADQIIGNAGPVSPRGPHRAAMGQETWLTCAEFNCDGFWRAYSAAIPSPSPRFEAVTMTHRPFRFFRALFGCALLLAATLAHADTLDTIKKNGVVRVGVFMDYPPFGSIEPDMKPQGYDIEMGEYLARALKAKAELVPITGENRMAYLATHKADLLLSVEQTPEREKIIDFSKPYAPYYLAVFGPKSLAVKSTADLAGKSVAGACGTLEDLSVTKAAPSAADIKRLEDPNGAISAFLTGQAQLLVVGNDVGATTIAKNPPVQPEQKFQLFSSPDHVGLNKGEPRLPKEVDDAIRRQRRTARSIRCRPNGSRRPIRPIFEPHAFAPFRGAAGTDS